MIASHHARGGQRINLRNTDRNESIMLNTEENYNNMNKLERNYRNLYNTKQKDKERSHSPMLVQKEMLESNCFHHNPKIEWNCAFVATSQQFREAKQKQELKGFPGGLLNPRRMPHHNPL